MSITLLGLNIDELRTLAQAEGEPAYRGNQLAEWLYRRRAHAFADMTNLPESLRERLARKYDVGCPRISTIQHSRDGTVKLLLAMPDGATVETVGMPYAGRSSCCISTQVGCRIECIFCATGLSGYTRDLTAGEIVAQVLAVQEAVSAHAPDEAGGVRVDHVTVMGMGEPLLNYAATVKAVRLLGNESGISLRHITVSTSGYVLGIRRLAREKLPITLAVSLHAATDDLRRKLIPGMTRWRVADIIDACRHYVAQTGRRVTFEYCLLDGVNDRDADARQLVIVLRGLNCHVNLIPYNPVPGLDFNSSSPKRVRAFRNILNGAGIQVTQRVQRGADIDAACGQLRRREVAATPKP